MTGTGLNIILLCIQSQTGQPHLSNKSMYSGSHKNSVFSHVFIISYLMLYYICTTYDYINNIVNK